MSKKGQKECVACLKFVTPATEVPHECGHSTHAFCHPDTEAIDFEMCPHCRDPDAIVAYIQGLDQPRDYNGRDYIEAPLTAAGALLVRTPAALGSGRQLDALMIQENYSLQYLLAHGVTLQMLFDRGYTWDDLCVYKDLAADDDRTRKALIALKCDAEYFANGKIPRLQCVTGDHLLRHFGLQFPVAYNSEWTEEKLAEYGIRVEVAQEEEEGARAQPVPLPMPQQLQRPQWPQRPQRRATPAANSAAKIKRHHGLKE